MILDIDVYGCGGGQSALKACMVHSVMRSELVQETSRSRLVESFPLKIPRTKFSRFITRHFREPV